MLRRSRTDKHGDGEVPPRRLLVAGADLQACSIYADVLSSYDFETSIDTLDDAVGTMCDTVFGCVVIVGTGDAEKMALKQVHAIRHNDHVQVRRTAVVLFAGSDRNQLFAWETGIDGLVEMPAHVDDIVAEIEAVLARPRLERYNHRQAMVEKVMDT